MNLNLIIFLLILSFGELFSLSYVNGEFGTAIAAVSNVSSNASGAAVDEAKRILGTLDANDGVNASGGAAVDEAKRILGTLDANDGVNASETVMDRANRVLEMVNANDTVNVTQTTMNEAQDILSIASNATAAVAGNATETTMNQVNRLLNESQNFLSNGTDLEIGPCIINPSSDLCNIIMNKKIDEDMCEILPLSDLCSKASENKARVEANAQSIISKCLNDPLSVGCNNPMIHLIKTCESFNYLLDYCDKEKLIKSTFYDLYEKEQNVGK
jgi:hypothetical protein